MDAPVPLEAPPCPVCGGEDYAPVLTGARDHVWRKPGTFDLQACGGCGLVALRPRPTPAALGFYYEGTYSGEGQEGMRRFQTESGLGKLIGGGTARAYYVGVEGADGRRQAFCVAPTCPF